MTTDLDKTTARENALNLFEYYLGRKPGEETLNRFINENFTNRQIENFITISREFRRVGHLPALPKLGAQFDTANLILEPAKVIFCPIAKNANTSIKTWFLKLSGINVSPDVSIHERASKSTLRFSYHTRHDLDQVMVDPDYAKTAVLRDPVERIVSAYWDKCVRTRTDPTTIKFHTTPIYKFAYKADEVTPQMIEEGVSFRQFCHYLSETSRNQTDPHWTAQHRYLEGLNWTHLFDLRKIETFEKFVLDRCPEDLQSLRLGIQNVSPTAKSTARQHKVGSLANTPPRELSKLTGKPDDESFIDTDIQAFIGNYFAMDYRLLETAER